MTVDCMACLVNAAMPDLWPHEDSGPRGRDGTADSWLYDLSTDEHGIRHAFVRGKDVPYRGWWKCDFLWDDGKWWRNWSPAWDP